MMDGSSRSHDLDVSSNGTRISGSGHFAVQVMRQSKDQHLPFILEDKNKSFIDRCAQAAQTELNQADYIRTGTTYPRNDEVRNESNRVCRTGEGAPSTKKRHEPISKGNVDAIEVNSISSVGNGTHFDREVPSCNHGTNGGGHVKKAVTFQSDTLQEQPWVIQQCPNEAHPLLECPPLYWMVRGCPGVLDAIKHLYSYRWRISYPLQRRVFLSQELKKLGIFCTIGELLLMLPLLAIFLGGLLFAFVWPSTYWSGHVARLPLILALATAMRNSIITLLIGLPFERGRPFSVVCGCFGYWGSPCCALAC